MGGFCFMQDSYKNHFLKICKRVSPDACLIMARLKRAKYKALVTNERPQLSMLYCLGFRN